MFYAGRCQGLTICNASAQITTSMYAGLGEAMKEALAIGAESIDEVSAARIEQGRGEPELSIGLLLQSLAKERESLELFEQGIETLKQAVEDRRHALDQQEELLNEFSREVNQSIE